MSFEATITSIHEMTPEVKQFVVEANGEFEYEPGQHTTVQFDPDEAGIDAEEDGTVVRPYTATNLPGTDAITLAIKRYDDGTASVYMHERETGDTITLGELEGNLTVRDTDEDVAFVSTGTGITPMIPMLRHYLKEGTGEVYFFYGEKTQESIMYRETLDTFETEHENLSVIYSLSDEEWDGPTGHVQEHIEDHIDDVANTRYYTCGVPQMVVDTKERLDELGVPDDHVVSEGWEDGAVGE
ncbi:phenol hydroxylase [Halobacteriales archaeon QS_8_65_32]|jgi:ferredoxin-NADP reductase|nr:MAG: phenol hydroxylase [Halobacteriales archaeon QS_8_65_32]